MQDRNKKGRTSHDTGNFAIDHKGEKNPNSKLTENQIIEIRNSNLKNKELAKKFNVSCGYIYKLKNFKRWRKTLF
jgi:DNA invertase Pin-like site-specific DNA recombinase